MQYGELLNEQRYDKVVMRGHASTTKLTCCYRHTNSVGVAAIDQRYFLNKKYCCRPNVVLVVKHGLTGVEPEKGCEQIKMNLNATSINY